MAASSAWVAEKQRVTLVRIPSFLKRGDGAQAVRRQRHLDHHVVGERGEAVPLRHDLVVLGRQHLARDRAGHQLRDLLDGRQVRLAGLGDQRRVGGDAVDHAPLEAGLDLFDLRGIEEEFHGRALPFRPLSNVAPRAGRD